MYSWATRIIIRNAITNPVSFILFSYSYHLVSELATTSSMGSNKLWLCGLVTDEATSKPDLNTLVLCIGIVLSRLILIDE
jgi:hypothetical protein